MGVDLFFVLSGFLVSGLLFREHQRTGDLNLRRFFWRRGLKIYPAFWVFLIVTLVGAILSGEPLKRAGWLGEVLFLQNYLGGRWGHTWSLAVEEHFYILMPLGLLAAKRHFSKAHDPFARLPWAVLLLAAALLVARIINASLAPFTIQGHFIPTHLRLDSLLFGVLLSYWYHYHTEALLERVGRNRFWLLACASAALLPFAWLSPHQWVTHTVGYTMIYLGCGTLLLLAVTGQTLTSPWLAPVRNIGVYSYSIYLYHLPLATLLTALGERYPGTTSWLVIPYLAGSILIGVGMAKLVEFPILRLRERWLPAT